MVTGTQATRTRRRARPRTDTHGADYTLCLHSPITDTRRSYAIMIDLPAWLMTGELAAAKSDRHDFRARSFALRSANPPVSTVRKTPGAEVWRHERSKELK